MNWRVKFNVYQPDSTTAQHSIHITAHTPYQAVCKATLEMLTLLDVENCDKATLQQLGVRLVGVYELEPVEVEHVLPPAG